MPDWITTPASNAERAICRGCRLGLALSADDYHLVPPRFGPLQRGAWPPGSAWVRCTAAAIRRGDA